MLRSQDSGILGTQILGFSKARSRIIWVCACLQPRRDTPSAARKSGEEQPLGLTRTQFPFLKVRTAKPVCSVVEH